MMRYFSGIGLSVLACLSFSSADPVPKVLEDFNPEKFVGKWWIIRVNERVFNSDEECAHFVISRKEGNTYNIVAQFHDTKSDSMRQLKFSIIDEADQPAIYDVLMMGKKIVETRILGTDYDNWAAIYISEGTSNIYAVASRRPILDASYEQAVNDIMNANNVKPEFQEVNGACVDTI